MRQLKFYEISSKVFLKVFIPPQDSSVGIVFLLLCPGQIEISEELIMTKDGTEARNRKYQDVCLTTTEAAEPRKHEVRIAYNNDPDWFLINNDTNTMTEFPLWMPLRGSEQTAKVPRDWEMLKVFFDNNKIKPIWINTHYTWGWYDEETGSWTGGVGQVAVFNLGKI